MKILYAIQGTGNGHLARAGDVIPALMNHGEVDLFVSGAQADIPLSYPIKYTSKGLSFYFGKDGGVDFVKTFRRNSSSDVYHEVKIFPVEKYDLIINDFEPITAWAAQKKDIPCIGLSHQAALLSSLTPRPSYFDPVGEWILNHYAPVKKWVGFHFKSFDTRIYTPVIRKEIRDARTQKKEHYTVYLPAYDDKKIVPVLMTFKHIRWEVFSKHTRKPYHIGNISVFPVSKEGFGESMLSCKGVLCGAGFETPAEALYLGKKLFVIPMKAQLEQHYNAAALKQLGVPVAKGLKKSKTLEKLQHWIDTEQNIVVDYKDSTADAIAHAISLNT
jgi:uncharacterized protein (TIGR00661 family)